MNENIIEKTKLFTSLPPEWPEELLPEIKNKVEKAAASCKVVIMDDDPTGTQTTRDLPVLTHWDQNSLEKELTGSCPAFFILTNSRSLIPDEACKLAMEIGVALKNAEKKTAIRTTVISRSDSTLRGHFPIEVDAMAQAMGKKDLPYLIIPFFLEGGRYTINDVHYVQEKESLVPASLTPFAKDKAFGFSHSNLKKWVEEKSNGSIGAKEVISVGIDDIRVGGPAKVRDILESVPEKSACIVNAVSYRDMEVVTSALLLLESEKSGKEFLYRTAASFVRTRTGLDNLYPLLDKNKLASSVPHGGLFIIGSYVEKTSSQLSHLLQNTNIKYVEVDVANLLNQQSRNIEIERAASKAYAFLKAGKDCAVFTSRDLVTGEDAEESLGIGRIVSDSLIDIVRSIKVQPRYLVAKGGITSSDVATMALGVKRAMVLGQALPGVPVWKLGDESRYPGMAYIIFPGNVGDETALTTIQKKLSMDKQDE
ncbi:four-carbon acid sugar kinase family protein [Desulfamplus magnetovallimortis]|nr:four-carbon acid sugar kinase family protein [Desulfamplus magnetovallimortis]